MSTVENRQPIVEIPALQLPKSTVHFMPPSEKIKKIATGVMMQKQHSTSSIVKRKLPQTLLHLKSPSASDTIAGPVSRMEKTAYPILSRSLSKTHLNPITASNSILQDEPINETPYERMYAFLQMTIETKHSSYPDEKKDFLLMLLTLDNEYLHETSALSQNLLPTFSLFKEPRELFENIYRALKILKRAKNHDFDRELLIAQKRMLLKFVNLFIKNNLNTISSIINKEIIAIIENEILPYVLKNAKKETKKICNEIKASIEKFNSIQSAQRKSITSPHIRTPDSSSSSNQEELQSFNQLLDDLFQNTKLSKKDIRKAATIVSSDLKTLFQSSLLKIDTGDFLNPNVNISTSYWTAHTNNGNKAFKYIKDFLIDKIKINPLLLQNYFNFFAEVAKESLNNRDFESAFFTYMALHCVSKELNIPLSRDTKKILTGCEATFAVQKNFFIYRNAIKQSSLKSTVFLSSVLAKDITFAIDGNKLPQRINMLADILRTINSCQAEAQKDKRSSVTNIGSLIEKTSLDLEIPSSIA